MRTLAALFPSVSAPFRHASRPIAPRRRAAFPAWCAALLLLAAGHAGAAGLGALRVTSYLGQPLVAEAEITSLQPKEFESIIVRMAQEESFKAAKVNYSPLVRQVRIEPLKRDDGTAVLRFTTVRAVNEPSLELLVDFHWPNGRLLQKYSILLDPAR